MHHPPPAGFSECGVCGLHVSTRGHARHERACARKAGVANAPEPEPAELDEWGDGDGTWNVLYQDGDRWVCRSQETQRTTRITAKGIKRRWTRLSTETSRKTKRSDAKEVALRAEAAVRIGQRWGVADDKHGDHWLIEKRRGSDGRYLMQASWNRHYKVWMTAVEITERWTRIEEGKPMAKKKAKTAKAKAAATKKAAKEKATLAAQRKRIQETNVRATKKAKAAKKKKAAKDRAAAKKAKADWGKLQSPYRKAATPKKAATKKTAGRSRVATGKARNKAKRARTGKEALAAIQGADDRRAAYEHHRPVPLAFRCPDPDLFRKIDGLQAKTFPESNSRSGGTFKMAVIHYALAKLAEEEDVGNALGLDTKWGKLVPQQTRNLVPAKKKTAKVVKAAAGKAARRGMIRPKAAKKTAAKGGKRKRAAARK